MALKQPPTIRTVCGDIPAREAGFAHCHEHTFILPGPSAEANRTLLLDDVEKTCAELAEFYAAGGRTIVDAQPIGVERAPLLQRAASERTCVHIVASSGFHRPLFYPSDHFRYSESADALAERCIAEVLHGMTQYDGANAVQTDVRAGLIKFTSEYHVIDAHARKIAEAVGAAHLATGAPIITHTEMGTCGMEQVELFASLGVAPSALLVSHLDRNPDIYLHDDIAASGAYLVYDGVSRAKSHPDSTIVELIRRMVEAGHSGRILLAMDMGPRTMWRAYGGGPGMAYLKERFLPKLLRGGLGENHVRAFTIDNPANALALRDPNIKDM